jgi:hypothetical protein
MKKLLLIFLLLISRNILAQPFTYSGYVYDINGVGMKNYPISLYTKEISAYDITYPAYSSPTAYNAGTVVSSSDDVVTGPYNIGFNFIFFGISYSQFYVCSNGWIGFSSGQTNGYTAAYIPNASSPRNVIMADWEDLYPGTSNIYYTTIGAAPNRKLVVSFYNCPHYSCRSTLYTFQFVLYETSNVIDINMLSKPLCTGYAATQGLVNSDNTKVVPVDSRNATTWSLSTTQTIRFTPQTAATAFTLSNTYRTNTSGQYTINSGLDVNNYQFQLQINAVSPTTNILTTDIKYLSQLVLKSTTPTSKDYYTVDANGDGSFSVSDMYWMFMKQNGVISTWGGLQSNTRILTSTEANTIKTGTSNLRNTVPGAQNNIITSPTNNGTSNFYIISTGYPDLTKVTF